MLNHTDVKKTRAVIDLNAIAGNYMHTAKACAPAKVAAVVKADAYGHGALAVAKRLNAVGCDFSPFRISTKRLSFVPAA